MARALSLSAVAALMFNQATLTPAFASDYRIGASPSSADGQSNARFLSLGVGKSVDGLVMVLLGGVQALSGPWVGGALFTWLQDTVARQTDYWRALLGAIMLALVLVFPLGIAGTLRRAFLKEPA